MQWDNTIEVGTRSDDWHLYTGHLYLKTTNDGRQKLILNRDQVHELAAALVETISKSPISPAAA